MVFDDDGEGEEGFLRRYSVVSGEKEVLELISGEEGLKWWWWWLNTKRGGVTVEVVRRLGLENFAIVERTIFESEE